VIWFGFFNNISAIVAVSFIGGGNQSTRRKPPIVAVSFIGGGNRSTWRKPTTCRKSQTKFVT